MYGLVVLFLLHYLLYNKCGFRKKNMLNLDLNKIWFLRYFTSSIFWLKMKRILKHLTFFLPLLSHLPSYFCSIINHSLILLLSFLFFSSLSKFCPSSLFPLPTADLLTHSTINISQHYIYILYICVFMCIYMCSCIYMYLCSVVCVY